MMKRPGYPQFSRESEKQHEKQFGQLRNAGDLSRPDDSQSA